MLLGLGIPTCREGVAYSPGFAGPREIVEIAQAAKDAGYHSIWANQHLLTQTAIAATAEDPPNYYDPIVVLSYLAAHVDTVKLVFGTLVAPVHNPLVLAKQVSTLDQFSGGRVVLGLGIGAYPEEIESVSSPGHPKRHRGRTLEELILSLRVIFSEGRSSFHGSEFDFEDIECYPKPFHGHLPILVSGNSRPGLERAARIGNGWIVASRSPEEIAAQVGDLHVAARTAGRDPSELEVAAQLWVCVDGGGMGAVERLVGSQHFKRLEYLTRRPREELIEEFRERNLLGSVDTVVQRLVEYESAGVDHAALVFLGEDPASVICDARAVIERRQALMPERVMSCLG